MHLRRSFVFGLKETIDLPDQSGHVPQRVRPHRRDFTVCHLQQQRRIHALVRLRQGE